MKQHCHCTGQTSQGVNYGPEDDCPDCFGDGFVYLDGWMEA